MSMKKVVSNHRPEMSSRDAINEDLLSQSLSEMSARDAIEESLAESIGNDYDREAVNNLVAQRDAHQRLRRASGEQF